MKNTELRLGNYVYEGDHLTHVYSLEDELNNYINCSHIEGEFFSADGEIKPIPITEELLIKSEFRILEHEWKFFEKKISRGDCNSFVVRLWFNQRWYFGIYGHDGGVAIPVEFFHQVQNLYYDLSGEELIVKL